MTTGPIEIRELSPGNVLNEIVLIKATDHNGSPAIYLGTEGSQTIIQDVNYPSPRNIPFDETAKLTWNGTSWVIMWE